MSEEISEIFQKKYAVLVRITFKNYSTHFVTVIFIEDKFMQ